MVFVLFMINVYVNNKINLLELELYVNVYNRCYVLENMCDWVLFSFVFGLVVDWVVWVLRISIIGCCKEKIKVILDYIYFLMV